MTTTRERKEARIQKRLDWAETRRAHAESLEAQNGPYAGDIAFLTQPGHIPERDRANRRSERAFEDLAMAKHHEERAEGIAAQLDRTIFSDDPDAPDRLRARIAELQAERDARKRANAAYKRGGWEAVIAEVGPDIAAHGQRTMELCPWEKVPYPPYSLSNIGANIRRLAKRLEEATK